jgi:hypothetical protein
MKKIIVACVLLVTYVTGSSQELYVYTEPASNMPAKSLSAKLTGKFVKGLHSNRTEQRILPEVMLGLNKNWMIHVAASFSDMYSSNIRWESVKLYAKYRFLSNDDVHSHFRMAAFAEVAHSVNPVFYDELSLDGDQSGVLGGVVATQLINKLALSATASYLHVTTEKPKYFPEVYPYDAFNYTVSAGYLLFPFNYTSYKQLNVNLYTELLGQQILDKKLYYVDFAPAVQFIFNSNAKLNAGYRWQFRSNMHRMAKEQWLVSFEYVFLNALRSRKK